MFLAILHAAAIKHRTDVHTYVLMTNHVHLIVTPQVENGLAATMKDVGQTYVDTSTGDTSARRAL